MSYFEDASVVFIPSAVKDGKTYSIKPTDGSGDLTFSRGSDIEATRVAANGYIQKAAVNLLLQSNSYDTTWSLSNATITGGQSGYDGSSDAWLLENTDAGGYITQSPTLSGVQTISVYAKAGTLDFIRIRSTVSGTNVDAYFDLSTGTYSGTTVGTAIDATITSMGSGWYRCTLTYNESITSVRFYPAIAYNDLTDTSGNIYIQDAQLNYGLVAQEYQETTTTSVVTGITNDMPRLDYSGGASCPSLKLEPSRSNLFTYDTYLNGLTFIQATATQNTDTSPEGVQNAARLYDNAVDAQHRVGEGISVTSGTTYTWSVFAKKGTLRYCYLISTANGTERYFFDLQEGTAITSGGTIEDYGNGWYRLSAQATASATGSAVFGLNLTNDAQDNTYAGTGTDYHIVYGFQCEEGSYPTSLIPTYGTSATRTADACSKTGISSLIGQTEGTMYVETTLQNIVDNKTLLRMGQSASFSNSHILQVLNQKVYAESYVSSVNQAEIFTTAFSEGDKVKIGYAYKANDYVLYVNGVQIGTDTSASVPSSVGTLYVGNIAGTEQHAIEQALLFPTRLSNSDLAALTSL